MAGHTKDTREAAFIPLPSYDVSVGSQLDCVSVYARRIPRHLCWDISWLAIVVGRSTP